MVSWRDNRSGDSRVYARRILTDGTLLGEIYLHTMMNWGGNTRVASNGADFLVIWYEWFDITSDDVLGRVVLADGSLPGGIIAVSDRAGDQTMADLDFDGANYLAVFYSYDTSADIRGQFVAPDGTLRYSASDENIVISDAVRDQYEPALAYVDGFYLVVWRDSRWLVNYALYGQEVATDGTLLDTASSVNFPVVANALSAARAALASDGTDALAAYYTWGGDPNVYGVILSP
jgi:hypothetical protein